MQPQKEAGLKLFSILLFLGTGTINNCFQAGDHTSAQGQLERPLERLCSSSACIFNVLLLTPSGPRVLPGFLQLKNDH